MMGKIVKYHCPKCNWRKQFKIGKSKMQYLSFDKSMAQEQAVINDIMKGKYGEPLKAYNDSHEIVNYDALEEGLFYCEDCHKFKLAQIISIEYTHRNHIIKTKILPYCSKCKNEMKRIDNNEDERHFVLHCPECGEIIEETAIAIIID